MAAGKVEKRRREGRRRRRRRVRVRRWLEAMVGGSDGGVDLTGGE